MDSMARTAGNVCGTPDWQLDRMFETDTERKLEQIYREDDFPKTEVASAMGYADEKLCEALTFLCRASDKADGYPLQPVIDSLVERLEDFRCDVNAERRKIG